MKVVYRQSPTVKRVVRQEYDGAGDPNGEPYAVDELSITERIDFEVPDMWDFYLDPIASVSIERAMRVVEREWKTEEELLKGVITEEYDADAVLAMIKAGPSAWLNTDRPRNDQDVLEGLDEKGSQTGLYEVYSVVGLMPYLIDLSTGEPRIPEDLQHRDFLWMCSTSHNVVFKDVHSPFPVRPYAHGNAIEVPGRFLGHGVVSMVSAIQDEMTAILRARIDAINLTMNPMMKVPNNWLGHYSKWRSQPGNLYPYMGNDPNQVVPMQWDLTGLQFSGDVMGELDADAMRLTAAQGLNTMSAGKVRKNKEVDFTKGVIDNKFALFLMNLNRAVAQIVRIYVETRKKSMTGELVGRKSDQQVAITAADMASEFRVIPHANADNASVQQRLEVDQLVRGILGTSPTWNARIAVGDLDGSYKLDAATLGHIGIRNPQAYLGREPGARQS